MSPIKKLLKDNVDVEVKHCYITENISPSMNEIIMECKSLQNENIINSVWTFNGNILIKYNNGFGEKTRKIFHISDIDFLYEDENEVITID